MVSTEHSLANNSTVSSFVTPNVLNVTSTNKTLSEEDEEAFGSSDIFSYVLLPLGSIIFIIALIVLIVFLIRKKRLDKLRHHLMPLYSFDPTEEGEDWEAELLEEGGTDHNPRGKNIKATEQPQLSFHGNL